MAIQDSIRIQGPGKRGGHFLLALDYEVSVEMYPYQATDTDIK